MSDETASRRRPGEAPPATAASGSGPVGDDGAPIGAAPSLPAPLDLELALPRERGGQGNLEPLDGLLPVLYGHYRLVNGAKFEGRLPQDYRITFNPFLRRLTGRITYGLRLIEISTYHTQQYGLVDALATMEHEMLHLYLHTRGWPSGHNAHFKRLAGRLGIRVFHANPYPRNRPARERYLFQCPACDRMVFRRRRPGQLLACGVCCRAHAAGQFDPRFQLRLIDKVRMA